MLDTPDGELIIDTGARGSETALHAGLDALGSSTDRVLITHAHIDHWGLATSLAERVLAHPGVRPTFEFMEGRTRRDPRANRMVEAFAGFMDLMTGIPEIEPINEGERIGDWEILYTPGHDLGHVCLFRESDGVLLCGDVLLPGFTPNVQPAADGSDALADYLTALRRLGAMPITLVLPAHGEAYTDAAQRSRELLAHHEERLATLCAAMRDGVHTLRGLRDLTFRLDARARGDRMLAALETYAHLDHLSRLGQARLDGEDHWSLTD